MFCFAFETVCHFWPGWLTIKIFKSVPPSEITSIITKHSLLKELGRLREPSPFPGTSSVLGDLGHLDPGGGVYTASGKVTTGGQVERDCYLRDKVLIPGLLFSTTEAPS